jgi:hypothetical protein
MQAELLRIANDTSKDLYLYSELVVRGNSIQDRCNPWSFFAYSTLFAQTLVKDPYSLTMYSVSDELVQWHKEINRKREMIQCNKTTEVANIVRNLYNLPDDTSGSILRYDHYH